MLDLLRISAVDIGTNTVKVLHAIRHPDGVIEHLEHVTNTIRIGAGIETTGEIEPARIDAGVRFLQEQETHGRALGSTVFCGVATEALRIASNGTALTERIAAETGWRITVIPGTEEARLTFVGLKDLIPEKTSVAIVDIGGGSTEMIIVDQGEVVWQQSLRIGSGRLADRFFMADPPGMESTAQAFAAALESLPRHEDIPVAVETILFSGGNGVFLQTLLDQILPQEPFTLHAVERLLQHLAITPASDTVDRLGIMLARAQVLPAGAAIALAALTRTLASSAKGVPSGILVGLISEAKAP
jgi:exopolyphosphatase / guanosine-5'-triphosphate,3'-diphosphate pyrophosphatase